MMSLDLTLASALGVFVDLDLGAHFVAFPGVNCAVGKKNLEKKLK